MPAQWLQAPSKAGAQGHRGGKPVANSTEQVTNALLLEGADSYQVVKEGGRHGELRERGLQASSFEKEQNA